MKKNNFKLFFVMVTVIMVVLFGSVFTSCSNDDDLLLAGDPQTEQVSTNCHELSAKEAIEYVSSMYGAKKENIVYADSILIVDDDIVFDIKSIENVINQCTTRAHHSTPIVPLQCTNIAVYPQLSGNNALPNAWYIALLQALVQWNNLGGPVHFSVISSINQVYNYDWFIAVTYETPYQSTSVAQAQFPTAVNKCGSWIRINPVLPSDVQSFTADQKTHICIHEIGHTIGFGHTDPDPDEGLPVISVPDIYLFDPPHDGTSVMREGYPTSTTYSTFFSPGDIKAYQILYNWN